MQLFGSRKTNLNNVLKIIIRNNIIKQRIVKQRIVKQRIVKKNIIEQNIIEQNMPINKIICVGQPKTGTKTLKQIFTLLGIKVSSNPSIYKINDVEYCTVDSIHIDTNNFFTPFLISNAHY